MDKNTSDNSISIGRREFIAASAACGIVGSVSSVKAAAFRRKEEKKPSLKRKDSRPNILVITTDQQWAGAMSCEANPYLSTPAMDSLARNGMQFEAAYCPNPICVPSRSSYMTGLMPHEVGVTYNFAPEDIDEFNTPCFVKYFKDAGYETGHLGKWHLPRAIEDTKWSGFDYIDAIKDNEVDFLIPEPAAKFIKKDRDKPFLLFTSFVNPHDICEWARMATNIEDRLKNGEIGELPPAEHCPPFRANREIPEGEPSAIREHQAFETMRNVYPTREWDKDDPRWRQYLWAYYRMTELVDKYIGQVLDALRESGQEENTLIVLSSDHGDGIGSHRWNQKTIFYDEVSRVPFIVSWKGKTIGGSRSRDHLVNLGTDLCVTLMDAAGIEKPDYLKGISALPVAMGKKDAKAHEYVVSENNLHERWAHRGKTDGRMVRSKRYKYAIYTNSDPSEQLFDMQLDPGELRDLSKDPKYTDILKQHRQMLKDYIKATNDDFTAPAIA